MATKPKAVPLPVIVWANIIKWMTIRGANDDEIAAILHVKELAQRKRNHLLTVDEMGDICAYLAIEPEKLLER